jgi:hypothetical protein
MQHEATVGLCASCAYARRIESRRGSAFYLCGRAGVEPGYDRYPRLPVRECDGHQSLAPAADD